MSELIRVDPRYPGAWATLEPYLSEALEKGNGTCDWLAEDIYVAAVENRIMLWALVDDGKVFGALATVVAGLPRRVLLEILAMGADAHTEDKWSGLLEQLKQYAAANGIHAIVGTGRPGWARKLGATERRVFEIGVAPWAE